MKNKSTDELAKILWNFNILNSEIEKSDCIIVLGSNDIRVAERGSQLFLNDFAPLIVFSGGFGRLSNKNWTKSEAETFADVALKIGIPSDKIIIESKSTNTGENIRYSLKLLSEKSLIPKKVLLITIPYMERRAYATFKILFPEIKVITASPNNSYDNHPNEAISKEEMINAIVGDTQRIKLYPERGFMINQEIPDGVWKAFEELVKRGFIKHLISG